MTRRAASPTAVVIIVGLAGPCEGLSAQAVDSTGMPSLELLAMEAGRASRRHPIGAVASAILCDPAHPLVDSASLAACAALAATKAAAITAAFARGLEASLVRTEDGDSAVVPICPKDVDRVAGPRILLARVTAPVVGMRDEVWEGRLTVELRCRSPAAAGGVGIVTMGKEFLYQWSGRAWRLYQHSSWRAVR
ncbi:MAG TPA: hypothetical protein VH762_07885 [Gemmatimonadaceae bacterium]